MRVLLILPNFDAPLGVSVGLSYIAASLRRGGHEVEALHICEQLGAPWELDRVAGEVAEFAPGLVGISTGFNHYPEMAALAARIETDLCTSVVLGGIHPTLNAPAVMAENPSLSFLNVGEGEASMLELAHALEHGGDVTTIANIHARVDGVVHTNAPRPFSSLHDLPPMDTSIWDFQRITDLRRGWINVSAQRGCPWRCSYCHNNGEARLFAQALERPGASNAELGFLRYRPVDAMIEELVGLRDTYRMHAFSFIDDTFTMNPAWVTGFLRRYRDEVAVPFVCNTAAVNLDQELVEALADAGCHLVRMGVESGSDRLRSRLMQRPFPESRLRWAFEAVQAAGMHALAFNMIGNVGETRDETLETFRFNALLQPSSMKLSLAHPYPGTDYHDTASDQGAIDPARRTHNFIDASVLRRDADEALWLDKVATFYFCYVNREMTGAATAGYARFVDDLEALGAEGWRDAEIRAGLWARHDALSASLQEHGVMHYTAPFPERPDIVVSGLDVARGAQIIERVVAEPH